MIICQQTTAATANQYRKAAHDQREYGSSFSLAALMEIASDDRSPVSPNCISHHDRSSPLSSHSSDNSITTRGSNSNEKSENADEEKHDMMMSGLPLVNDEWAGSVSDRWLGVMADDDHISSLDVLHKSPFSLMPGAPSSGASSEIGSRSAICGSSPDVDTIRTTFDGVVAEKSKSILAVYSLHQKCDTDGMTPRLKMFDSIGSGSLQHTTTAANNASVKDQLSEFRSFGASLL